MEIYAAHRTQRDKVLQSSSGGVAAAVAEETVNQGGWVAGVVYSSDFRRAEYLLTNQAEDLPRFRGSKYIDARKKGVFHAVKEKLDQGEAVTFFGLPCTVAALYAWLEERPKNLLTCELVCHGPTTQAVHEGYLELLEQRHHSRLTAFSVRHKEGKWHPAYLRAEFANGDLFQKEFYQTEYGRGFQLSGLERCYTCPYKGEKTCGDLKLGDFWGAKESDGFWNEAGVSLVFARTAHGKAALENCPGLRRFPVPYQQAVEENPMVVLPRQRHRYQARFARLLANKGLAYAAKHCTDHRARLRGWVKGLLRRLR